MVIAFAPVYLRARPVQTFMRSSSSRQPVGPFIPSTRLGFGRRRRTLGLRSALMGATLMSGAILVVPARRAWAQSPSSDENGPKVQILTPAYQDVLKSNTRILVGIAAGQYNPATIELWVDNRAVTRALPLTSLASMSFNWDTRRFSDGPHKLTIRVTDTQGFRGLKDVNIFINNGTKHDIVAPGLKWKNLSAFQQMSGQTQVELETKNSFGVKWILVKVTPVDKSNTSAGRSWMLGGGQVTFKFDTTKVADGIYTLTAKAWDALDQEGNAPTLTIGVVNSPINATTVGESLDGLRQMAKVERDKENLFTPTPTPSLPKLPAKANAAPTRPLASSQVVPGMGAAPAAGLSPRPLPPLFVPRSGAVVSKKPSKTATTKRPLVARPGQSVSPVARPGQSVAPDLHAPGALSKPDGAGVVSSSPSEVEAAPTPGKTKTFIARSGTPEAPVRVEESVAALSAPTNTSVSDALSPAQLPVAEAPASTRVEIARLALPTDEAHALDLDVAPALSSAPALNSVASPGSQVELSLARRAGSELVASSPLEEAASGRPSIETPRVPSAAQNQGSETVGVTKTGPRIAALPSRPNAGLDNATPSDEHPAITVSPVQMAFDTALPKQHLVKTETTLRALAGHYGLPVEMVAAANNWNANMRVIPGMVVLLPRQVQVSYNGQKVGGDVSSLLIGDTTVTAMRFLFEKTGGKLEWNAEKQEVIARKGASTIRVKIGSNVASVGNKQVMMQLAAFLFEGRTMIPTRFFEEGLDAQVEWNPDTGHLVVAMAN